MPDPDLEIIEEGGGGDPELEIKGGGGRSPKKFSRPFGPQFGIKTKGKGGGGPARGPATLDPPLIPSRLTVLRFPRMPS